MRIHSVTMTGFGPYPATETVDFDAYADDGLFLITGKTGSGKTSILDAICFALFGRIPRYDGTAGEKVRSDHIGDDDASRVQLEFSTAEGRYRIWREPEHHPAHRKTAIQQKAEIARLNGGTWEVLESQVRNVGHQVKEIVRLDDDQFLQVILLAQGQFQEFLVADSDKRRDLLRTLFNSKRFSDYTDELTRRAKELRERIQTSITAIRTNLDSLAREVERDIPETVDPESGPSVLAWAEPVLDEQRAAVAQAGTESEKAKAAYDTAKQELDRVVKLRELQESRDKARKRLAELEAEAEEITKVDEGLAAAHQAELAWQAVEASNSAAMEHESAKETHAIALRNFAEAHPDKGTTADDLSSSVEALTRQLGELQDDLALETGLPAQQEAAEAAAEALAAFETEAGALSARREELKKQLTLVDERIKALSAEAALVLPAEKAFSELSNRLDAAQKAARTTTELEAATQRQVAALRDHEAALGARRDLVTRRLVGHAAELAQDLVDGEPCAVCGSTAHPSPAPLAADHVTEADVEAAEAALNEADSAVKAADQEVTALTTRLEAEKAAAAGASVVELEPQLAAAKTSVEAARHAVTEHEAATAERTKLQSEVDATTVEIEQVQSRRTELTTLKTMAEQKVEESAKAVDTARGEHPSVAARIAAVESERDLASALLTATSTLTSAAAATAKAAEALSAALLQHGFDEAAAVAAARVSAADQSAMKARVDSHRASLTSVQGTLNDPDLADVPEEPVDATGPTEAYEAAEALATGANKAHIELATRLKTIDGLVTEIRKATETTSEVQARYEVLNGLANAARGQGSNTHKMMLETFVLAAELEEIVKAANTRLKNMTGGRYQLQHTDELASRRGQSGLGLTVIDAHTGQGRPPQSLSGGEKFQASLALALGLAEVVTSRNGGLQLDTLFIDEGFGSLDSDTLETTMATLDSLREGGRTIGLISHVESMKESIPRQIKVDVLDSGGSTITTN